MAYKHEEIIIGHFDGKLLLWYAEYLKKICEKLFKIPVYLKCVIPAKGKDYEMIAPHIYSSPHKPDFSFFAEQFSYLIKEEEIDVMAAPLELMPGTLPYPLYQAAIINRVQNQEALISKDRSGFYKLPAGAKVGVYSLRQIVQLKLLRPDLKYCPVSPEAERFIGIDAMEGVDACVYPLADLKRLNFDRFISEIFSIDALLPAPRQSAIICVSHRENSRFNDKLKGMMDNNTAVASACENGFIENFNPPFDAPLGAFAELSGSMLRFTIRSVDPNTLRVFEDEYISEDIENAYNFGSEAAYKFEKKGGRSVFF